MGLDTSILNDMSFRNTIPLWIDLDSHNFWKSVFSKKNLTMYFKFFGVFFCLLYVIHFLCTCDLYVIFILFLPSTQNRVNFEITFFQ
jgi:hypothetical protein